MKRHLKRIAICLLCLALTISTVSAASFSDFKDAQNHWAKADLERAVREGVLNGMDPETLAPNGSLTGSQMAAILIRYLDLQHYTDTYPGTTAKQWYYYETAIAYSAGILPEDASVDLDAPVTRSQVFSAFQGAFFTDPEDTDSVDTSVLDRFPDAGKLDPDAVEAAAVLVDKKVVIGDEDGNLRPDSKVTRAEFVTMLYRASGIGQQAEEAGSKDICDMKIRLTANNVPAGGRLTASAKIIGPSEPVVCRAEWLVDREPLAGFCNNSKSIAGDVDSAAHKTLEFTLNMPLSHRIGLKLEYTDPATGQVTTVIAEKTVYVTNYDKSHYAAELYQEALKQISCKWSGGTPDYSQDIKEAYINGRGLSSKTKYLAWVNIATQKVNIFEGSKGNWKLTHTFNCCTGSVAKKHDTPVGVTYVTYKQSVWDFVPGRDKEIPQGYIVRYITRFYPNTGYAFHSILYARDGSGRIIDGTMGQPASHGCVRTEDVGVKWIYNNLPVNSTVVIY